MCGILIVPLINADASRLTENRSNEASVSAASEQPWYIILLWIPDLSASSNLSEGYVTEKSSSVRNTLGNLLNIDTEALPNERSPSIYSAAYLLTILVRTFSERAT